MGRRGPLPEPATVKIAKGETRPSKINRSEPLPRFGAPRMPGDMSDRAKTVWKRMLETAPPDLITAYDADLLRIYCEAFVMYQESHRLLAGAQPLVRYRDGLVKNPLHQMVRDNRDAVLNAARMLGAAPGIRASMSVGIGGGSATPDIDADIGLPRRLRLVAGDE